MSGGPATVFDATRDAFSLPVPLLDDTAKRAFFVGNSFFNQNWVVAPASVSSRDGLGPLFNARSCSGCHFKDGRGRPPEASEPLATTVLRISAPGEGPHGGPLPDRVYGDQIQGSAIPGIVPEADVTVEYDESSATFDDGERVSLRRPRYHFAHWGYGLPDPALQISARVAPAMVGLGLLEGVSEQDLALHVDANDADHDGISGRTNRVWSEQLGRMVSGRFGWKAEQPSVAQQTAGALRGDIGISSAMFLLQNHTEAESATWATSAAEQPEIAAETFSKLVFYARTLGVPARRSATDSVVRQGAALFVSAGCASCHLPALRTGNVPDVPGLSHVEFHAYTDLLLHDMGEGLSDHRPAYEAQGAEWRTAPLWGLGLLATVNGHTLLLHDGRARGTTEAILWHGGEAAPSRERFLRMNRSDRRAMSAFLDSL